MSAKKKYKKVVKDFHLSLKREKNNKLMNIPGNNPKEFWKQVHSLLKGDTWEHIDIRPDDWITHFNKLLNAKCDHADIQFQEYVKSSLPLIENCNGVGALDFPITQDEINRGIGKLKQAKHVGLTQLVMKC